MMPRQLKKCTAEIVQQVYAIIGANPPTDPVESVTITFTDEQLIKIVETRYAMEELVPFVPKAPD